MYKRLSTALLVLVLLGLAAVHRLSADGLQAVVVLGLGGDDTLYAPGFTEAGFASVRSGEAREEVRALLGEPVSVIAVDAAQVETWHYTRSPHSRHYRIRAVVFERGHVVDKLSELYFD